MGDWTKTWQLRFNPEKCEVMRITHQRDLTVPEYYLSGKKLKVVNQFKDIGVIITRNLSWSDQVTTAINTENQSFFGSDQVDCRIL